MFSYFFSKNKYLFFLKKIYLCSYFFYIIFIFLSPDNSAERKEIFKNGKYYYGPYTDQFNRKINYKSDRLKDSLEKFQDTFKQQKNKYNYASYNENIKFLITFQII